MSVPGVTFKLLDGRAVASRGDEDLLALHAESCPGDAVEYARQFRIWRRQPGFALAAAMHGGFLVGYAAGLPLRPSTSWWKDLTAPLPEAMTEEYPGRTFAVTTLLVRAPWRRQGIGASLHWLLLSARPEERATLTIPVAAASAQRAVRALGWAKTARTRTQDGGIEDVFLLFPIPNGPALIAQ